MPNPDIAEKKDAPPASPGLSEAKTALSIKQSPELRTSPFQPAPGAINVLTAQFERNNPATIGAAQDKSGAKPAQPASNNSNALQINKAPLRESPYARPFNSAALPAGIDFRALTKVPEQPAVAPRPVAQPTRPIRDVVIRLPQAEVQVPKTPEKSSLTKEQVTKERKEELPSKVEARSLSDLQKAMEKGAKLGVPVVVYFGTTQCPGCGSERSVLAKMEGAGRGSIPAVFVHVELDQIPDRGRSITGALGVRLGRTVPEVHVFNINKDTEKFSDISGNLGLVGYADLKNNIPLFGSRAYLSTEYVAQNREKLVSGVKEQLAANLAKVKAVTRR